MFAEYVQGNIDDASCLFDAANHDAECEAVKKQAYLLILRRFNKYKTMICIYHGSTIILTVHIMPYTIRKVRGRPCYRVKNRRTKRVFAKCTSKKNAKAQIKLLHAIDYNPKFQLRAAS